ncbi:hypothetical protein ASPSYDRAFT_90852 [Aspergillus sydowii CBS 593.65]|uniref:Uncharacterized protein n=1 Tax=Aspergillus sydowii CBS 593.65 TaxID=1036612 RepID=A0A1L9TDQ9_9EURO|nr:uncharacterized protein ASPSYDRAFT_90852 [Aspergillus sydowii CBS 593.65]OJJ57570.1 hypothetical protein ASPSYDRAFT_90852 [Aspergillus sydowii CBS 593.65]
MSHQRIIELFDESTNPEQDEHLFLLSRMEDLSLQDQGDQIQPPSEDYTVYIGRLRKPFFDPDSDDPHTLIVPKATGVCGNVLILHGTKSNTCIWIWISERKDEESGKIVLQKKVVKSPLYQDRCDKLIERKEVGLLRAADCEAFQRIVEERPAWTGTTFVFVVLEACSGEGVLEEGSVRDAFFDLGVSSMNF